MFEYYFTFDTMTAARSAMIVLDHFPVPYRTANTPKTIRMYGSAHSIVVRSGYFIQARDEFDRLKLTYNHIFCRMVDGSFEEVV